jgi:hypothetical protein
LGGSKRGALIYVIEMAKRKGGRKEGKASTAFTDTGVSNLHLVSKVT